MISTLKNYKLIIYTNSFIAYVGFKNHIFRGPANNLLKKILIQIIVVYILVELMLFTLIKNTLTNILSR